MLKTSVPSSISDNLDVWRPVHVAIGKSMSSCLSMELEAASVAVEITDRSGLSKTLTRKEVYFGYQYGSEFCDLIIQFDNNISQVMMQTSGLSPQSGDQAYSPTLLDTLMMRQYCPPIVAALEEILHAGPKTETRLAHKASHLLFSDFETPAENAPWVRLSCVLAEDSKTKESKTETKSSKKGRKTSTSKTQDSKSPTQSFTVNLLMPLELMLMALKPALIRKTEYTPSADNPWTNHIHKSVQMAEVPVRAVIETCEMTVADCTRLTIGQVIELPGVSLQSIGLQTEINNSMLKFAQAALGIYKMNRAVKLTEDNHLMCVEESIEI